MFTDVLHFIQVQLDHTTLTFGIGVCLTLYWCSTTLARNNLVFGHYFTKIQDQKLRRPMVNKYDKVLMISKKGCG